MNTKLRERILSSYTVADIDTMTPVIAAELALDDENYKLKVFTKVGLQNLLDVLSDLNYNLRERLVMLEAKTKCVTCGATADAHDEDGYGYCDFCFNRLKDKHE